MSAFSAAAMREGDVDLRSLGSALRRQKHWIIWPTLLVAIASGVAVNMVVPRYKSEARILYDGRENVFLRPEAEKSINQDRGVADAETVTNQIQIVLSRPLALDVIGELKLGELEEFDPVLHGISSLRGLLQMAGISRDLLAMSPEERVLESWYERLTAYPLDKSRVIVIEFQSGDPALAARVANTIADRYLRLQQSGRLDQTRGAGLWLADEIGKLRPKVAEAEAKADAFRSRTNLFVGTNNTILSNQQLGEFNSQVAVARGQKADAETRARIIRDMLRRGEPIESSDVVNSELIRRLSEQRVTLRAQLAEQSSTLLDGHPRIKELRAQLADLDRHIKAEAEKLVRTLENDAKIASARVDALSQNFDVLKQQAASINEQDVDLRALEREAKAQRDLLETYLARYRETTARDTIGNAPPDAKIISQALVSNTPAFPKKVPIVAVATLIAFILSAGMVTTGELLRSTSARPHRADAQGVVDGTAEDGGLADVITSTALQISTPATPIGAPSLATAKEEGAAATRVAAAQVSESERSAITAFTFPIVPLGAIADVAQRLRGSGKAGRGIALFGAVAGIPTSRPALTLARMLATEARVVLVGLAERPPAPDSTSEARKTPGLTDVIQGRASFGQAIAKDRLSAVHLIHHGEAELPCSDIVNSRAIRVMMDALVRAYTHVIVDAGQLGIDCGRIAKMAPHCVLIVPEDAPQETAAVCQRLAEVGFADITVMTEAAAANAFEGLAAA